MGGNPALNECNVKGTRQTYYIILTFETMPYQRKDEERGVENLWTGLQ